MNEFVFLFVLAVLCAVEPQKTKPHKSGAVDADGFVDIIQKGNVSCDRKKKSKEKKTTKYIPY